ncbi:molybdopterin molybdenumtransferase MoeA [Malaciobacter pacificus]|uniref:Molybdopterin molybdenumtransferase n=1 Tax=Malaciobacter pacificus TaxID=1080223 RepID=A0A5C2H8E5_9BACT|nr:molybdopterin molybdotransferase MoeA [Malaciobacter pacificus]QEP33486.1 molybdopterin molybdenumtransferase [Malaciobacter pacificus]GGD31923.1 molybdopterin molybdenumtransferase MoeA [Malaciobacter pacificus]
MAINIHEAIQIISSLNINLEFEIIPIENAVNRIISQDIYANQSLPKFNNSAMDGYAIIHKSKDKELKIIDTIFAGDDNNSLLDENSCIKIMTGARIPSNATAIVPKEDTKELDNGNIKIEKQVKEFQHIRFIGEDIKENELLITKGDEINFAKVTLLASQGITHIKVYKKPKIVVFSSGEELKLHYEKIEPHQIYNSNTPTLISRAKELGCDVNFIGQAKDSVESIKQLIQNSLDANLIITSGGVSVGDADFTKDAINKLNYENIFDGIFIKPGKPTVLGKIDNTYILNLPGNPLASSLILELFGRVLIQKLIGSNEIYPNYILGKLDEELILKKGRVTIIPGTFNGEYFSISKKRSPGMVSTLSSSNSMIVIDEKVEKLTKDSLVKILPINWKFFNKENKDFLTHE